MYHTLNDGDPSSISFSYPSIPLSLLVSFLRRATDQQFDCQRTKANWDKKLQEDLLCIDSRKTGQGRTFSSLRLDLFRLFFSLGLALVKVRELA